jgi:hypothetical protein
MDDAAATAFLCSKHAPSSPCEQPSGRRLKQIVSVSASGHVYDTIAISLALPGVARDIRARKVSRRISGELHIDQLPSPNGSAYPSERRSGWSWSSFRCERIADDGDAGSASPSLDQGIILRATLAPPQPKRAYHKTLSHKAHRPRRRAGMRPFDPVPRSTAMIH